MFSPVPSPSEGTWSHDGYFQATTILAKHSEEYAGSRMSHKPSPIASRLALTFRDRHVPACCDTTHCVADRATSAARTAITLSILETFETCHSPPPRAARVSIT